MRQPPRSGILDMFVLYINDRVADGRESDKLRTANTLVILTCQTQVRKLRFDPLEVRPSFKSKYCHELILPSGRKSGFMVYPISTDEVRKFTENFTSTDFEQASIHDICKTESEYCIWLALRLKYGVNYLSTKSGYRPINDNRYEPPKEPDIFEKVYNEINGVEERLFDEFSRQIMDLKYQEKDKKFLDEDLTSPATML